MSYKYLAFLCLFLSINTLYAQTSPEPSWVNDPYTVYPRDRYLAMVGYAENIADARNSALAELAKYFGQTIQADFSAVTIYSEAVSKGIIAVSENTNINSTIATSASMDMLIGAETGNTWDNGKGIIFAVAYMDRAKTIAAYSELIRENIRNIESLTALSPAEKNTFDGYARYKLAAVLSGMNFKYAGIISLIGGPAASTWNLPGQDSFNREASEITKNITIAVTVDGDQGNKIRDAFSKIITNEGLRTRGNNPPYTLEVTLDLNELPFPDGKHTNCYYTVSAELIENATNLGLHTFTQITGRGTHTTYNGAVSNAFDTMVKKINELYTEEFEKYLSALLPNR